VRDQRHGRDVVRRARAAKREALIADLAVAEERRCAGRLIPSFPGSGDEVALAGAHHLVGAADVFADQADADHADAEQEEHDAEEGEQRPRPPRRERGGGRPG